MENKQIKAGMLFGLISYVLWGALVYYWHLLGNVNSLEVFSYRIVFTIISMLVYFLLTRKMSKLRVELKQVINNKKSLALAIAASLFLGLNWLSFIYSVSIHQATQASIANFIMPLVSIVLSVLFLREHLEKYMWFAVAVAGIGVGWMIAGSGQFPVLTMIMSVCFPLYGLLKKYYQLSSDVAMVFESAVLLPFVLVYLVAFAPHHLWDYAPITIFGLFMSGIITAIPLLLFAEAIKRAPLHLVSFIQYVNPTIALILTVTVLGETLSQNNLISLIFIWSGIFLFIIGEFIAFRRHSQKMVK